MKLATTIAAASILFVTQACSPSSDETDVNAEDEAATEHTEESESSAAESIEMANAEGQDACPVLESHDWRAWVNAQPGPDASATLIVEGNVVMPTPGYAFSWEEGMADRSAIPMQRLHLAVSPPDGMVAQVITTEAVRYEGPAIAQNYRAVVVMCGDEQLVEIADVTTAQ